MYLLGRSFITESDHKLLEMITIKNLANAPPHLQRMLLQLQCFDITICYRPGAEMQLVDALSRCPAQASPEIKLNMHVDYIAFSRPWIKKLKRDTTGRPHSDNCVPVDVARLASPKMACSPYSKKVL